MTGLPHLPAAPEPLREGPAEYIDRVGPVEAVLGFLRAHNDDEGDDPSAGSDAGDTWPSDEPAPEPATPDSSDGTGAAGTTEQLEKMLHATAVAASILSEYPGASTTSYMAIGRDYINLLLRADVPATARLAAALELTGPVVHDFTLSQHHAWTGRRDDVDVTVFTVIDLPGEVIP